MKNWLEADFNEPTEEILTKEAIIQSVINPTAPKDAGYDEDDLDETNNIRWKQPADALNIFIKFSDVILGLTILQISDTQRRALVNYSYVTAKPNSTPTTAVPSRATTATTQESLINSISKSPTTSSILRGSSRGESQVKVDKKKVPEVISNLAKGDFADRVREKNVTKNETAPLSKDAPVTPSVRETSKKKDEPHVIPGATAAILSGTDVEESDDRVYARRVLTSGPENRAEDKSQSNDRSIRRNPPDLQSTSRLEITPTKAHATDTSGESLKVESPADRSLRDEARTQPRDYVDREKSDPPKRDEIQSSRRPDSETVYREPDFDREYPKRYATSSDRGRYDDDLDDERRSRGRYDKRERGRESDDRYPKGDTRVYPDDKILDRIPPTDEDRYRVRESYPDDIPRRGDDDRYDDRYKDYDEKPRIRDKDGTRYIDRDLDRSLPKSDRYKDDEKYRYRDEDGRIRDRSDEKYRSRDDGSYRLRDDRPEDDRYRSRGDDRYIPRDDDRYRSGDDDKYRSRDDDRYRLRDDDKYRSRDDDRYRVRDDDIYTSRDDDRYRYRDEERYRSRYDTKYSISDDEKYRTRDDDRYRSDPDDRKSIPPRSPVEEDRYRPTFDDDKSVDTVAPRVRDSDIRESVSRSSSTLPLGDRKPTSSRSQYDVRTEESITDYDVPPRSRSRLPVRDEVNPSRLSRPAYDEERYRDQDRDDRYRPTRYDEDEAKAISPTRTRIDGTFSRSTLIDTKFKDENDSRYADDSRDRIRNDKFYDKDERDSETRLQGSRSAVSTSDARRYVDENDRYRTRLPDEKIEKSKSSERREEVVLDRRSYASEEDGDYRRGASRTRDYYEDRSRSPTEDTRRRYRDDESYPRRDEDFKRDRPIDDISRDRSKNRDRYDDEYPRYDDRYISRDDDRYPLREDRLSSSSRKYDSYPDDDERPRRRDSEVRAIRTGDSRIRDEIIRPSASSRDEERFYSSDDFPETKPSSRRRYEDDLPPPDDYDAKGRDTDNRRYSTGSRRPIIPRESALGSSMSSMSSREPTEVVIREKRFQSSDSRYPSSRVISNERSYVDPEESESKEVRPLSAKDVIEAAIRHSDNSEQNSGQVHYPVFDPRTVNLTSSDYIRPGERRGTTITARKRRSA